jgi:Fe-S cluster biogenesis protein NfuA
MPETQSKDAGDLRQRVQNAINLVRPAIQADGGDVELLAVLEGGVVHVRFHGACQGCPSAGMTLHMGIERVVREHVPEVRQVLAV